MVHKHNMQLRIEGLSKRYRAGKEVFRDISLVIEPGEAVLLIGANGSGKTTFLKLLSLNSFPSGGRVFWGALNIYDDPSRYLRSVGLVHDEESLPNYLSALELLEWIVRSRECWNEQSPEEIHSLLDQLQLDESRSEEIGTYSTGMRKKVQIAAALVTRPELLILDEPLRGLDREATVQAMGLLRKAVDDGTTLLMATHGGAMDDALFDRVLRFPIDPEKLKQ